MKYIIVLSIVFCIISCEKQSKLNTEFNCTSTAFNNLQTHKDFKKNFTIKLPKNWKTNYYYDDVVSSIYTADTTLSLTQAILVDISHVSNTINIDDNFIKKIKNDNQNKGLQEVKSKNISFLDQPSYYNLSSGKKSKYNYHILNVFSKTATGFLHIKTEIYGDSLIDERICKSIHLMNNIRVE